jgi:hypothetical protein
MDSENQNAVLVEVKNVRTAADGSPKMCTAEFYTPSPYELLLHGNVEKFQGRREPCDQWPS